MLPIRTTDNSNGNCHIVGDHVVNLQVLAGKSLEELITENPQLLVFPECLKSTKDSIEKEQLFSIQDNRLTTYNMMGFVGINETRLTISSRFHTNEKDYFLHYMLQKVFSINMMDLQFSADQEDIWEIMLIYTFPFF
jgi:5-methylcytosine-specific restriction enzyme subunit McrC